LLPDLAAPKATPLAAPIRAAPPATNGSLTTPLGALVLPLPEGAFARLDVCAFARLDVFDLELLERFAGFARPVRLAVFPLFERFAVLVLV
jgi:hypothetical protein